MAEIIAAPVAEKAVDSLFGVAKKEISYMWYCTQNVEKLRKEVQKLKGMKERIQQQIDIAVSNGNNLLSGVENWVVGAGEEISKAEEFLKEEKNAKKTCFKIGICGNWRTLHHYGKKTVTERTPPLEQLQAIGTPYEGHVSVETPPPTQLDAYQKKNYEDLGTHNSALNAILAALEDESKQIIGIYGLGGVGKTTLAKEVVARVKNTLFADVAFTTVSQTPNVEKIQKDIVKATKRIRKGDKILIILDDVWQKLDLEELCIPCGSEYKNCKILLTSRSEKVCNKMNAESKICVNTLKTEEAWILFKRVVGEEVETDANLKIVAKKVAQECGGLPLLIQAVGSALKNEKINRWNSALTQLKKNAPAKIDEDIKKAFIHLKLSYDYLESEEAKSCFLLCSLFPEDEVIWLEDLVRYRVGLGNFEDLSMQDARDNIQDVVNILKSSGLLLKVSDSEEKTQMHDVVRDVALLIASEGNNKFLVEAGRGLTEWLPRSNSLETYKGISLMSNRITKLPDYEVHLPHLQFFIISKNREYLSMISDEFIGCLKEIKILDMGWCYNAHLPRSLKQLTKLRMLNLVGNESFQEISILGEMKELEILILESTGIKEIPQEIGQLVNLRLLNVSYCNNLSLITPGVISKLSRLEELIIDFRWMSEGVYDCVIEVMNLRLLTYLDMMIVPSIEDIPNQGFNYAKLKGFVIQIGIHTRSFYQPYFTSRSNRYLVLSMVHVRIPLVKWIKEMIEGMCPITHLYGIENLNNIMPTLYHESFNKLKDISFYRCPNMSCLVDSTTNNLDEGKTSEKYFMELKNLELYSLDKLEVIWKCPDKYISLTNLVKLHIWGCDKLVRIFTVNVAQGLVNLKDLSLLYSKGLEEVIWGDGNKDEIVENSANVIVFPRLERIFLRNLFSLNSFFNSAGNGNCSIKYPSLVGVLIDGCRSMKKWGTGIHETPKLKTLNVNGDGLVLGEPSAINDVLEKASRNKKDAGDDQGPDTGTSG